MKNRHLKSSFYAITFTKLFKYRRKGKKPKDNSGGFFKLINAYEKGISDFPYFV